MSIKLHNLTQSSSKRKKKRVGRGNGSGHGSYSTRGIKGQKSRSGVSGLKLKGMKHIILATPKLRGFKSVHFKAQTITLSQLDKFFNEGETVTPKILLSKKMIDTKTEKVKIVSSGEISKKLTIKDCKVSVDAIKKIEKAGGKVE
ncbi:50S ribosomal protein L15 [Candidatus Parcubacteria bacterium]|nr:50S ribosomal protein L15 [Patescibacteria group bacterium]MCG2694158.1 50S ribosomal protein L15 [Candidatus Parcubacteria bacterium]